MRLEDERGVWPAESGAGLCERPNEVFFALSDLFVSDKKKDRCGIPHNSFLTLNDVVNQTLQRRSVFQIH